MSEDDIAYNRSVRNMSVVLAVIVITVFAFIFIPPYISPIRDNFQKSVSLSSAQGFTLYLEINSTSFQGAESVNITAWVVNSQNSADNVTAANMWGVQQNRLVTRLCTNGFPIGIGVMKGHFDQDNYTLGSLIMINQPLALCPIQTATPPYFDFIPHSSRALITIAGNPSFWVIQTNLIFSGNSSPLDMPSGGSLPIGVYTVVAADEWGDVLTTNFRVT